MRKQNLSKINAENDSFVKKLKVIKPFVPNASFIQKNTR